MPSGVLFCTPGSKARCAREAEPWRYHAEGASAARAHALGCRCSDDLEEPPGRFREVSQEILKSDDWKVLHSGRAD